jgi:hypothetical protein
MALSYNDRRVYDDDSGSRKHELSRLVHFDDFVHHGVRFKIIDIELHFLSRKMRSDDKSENSFFFNREVLLSLV